MNPRGTEALLISADLENPENAPSLVHRALEHTRRLDILMNNAGYALAAPFHESRPEDRDRVMNLKAKTFFFLTQAALPALRRAPHPLIIDIGSVVSLKGYENQSLYSASKHALADWTKSLARETAAEGIRVHLIAPGGVDTDLVRRTRPDIDPSGLISPAPMHPGRRGQARLHLLRSTDLPDVSPHLRRLPRKAAVRNDVIDAAACLLTALRLPPRRPHSRGPFEQFTG